LTSLIEFNPYVLALPCVTVVPYSNFLIWMIRDYNPKKVKQNQQKLMRCVRIRRKIGIVLCILSILASIYGIFVIAANKNEAESLGWQVDFAITLFQDMVLGPIIFLIMQLIVFKATRSKLIKSPRMKNYISAKFLDKNIAFLYAKAIYKGMSFNDIISNVRVNGNSRIKRPKKMLSIFDNPETTKLGIESIPIPSHKKISVY
jgi:hypothetical protein